MKIPFLNLKKESEELIKQGLMDELEKTIKSGTFLFGQQTEILEIELSNFFKKSVVLVGSGTDAIALSLKTLGIKSNDLVAIPALSAIPTAIAVKMIGAIPIYVDINNGGTLHLHKLKKIIEKYDIKAIIPVHLYGNVALIHEMCDLSLRYNIPVIEDCAQSFGSSTKFNFYTGTLGVAGALSFYPTKNLGCMGDGGAIICSTKNFANSIKELRFYGQEKPGKMGKMIGMNSRMDEIQCTILLKKLQLFKEQANKRITMRYEYDSVIKNTKFNTIQWKDNPIPHLYPIFTKQKEIVKSLLLQHNIETGSHYQFHLEEEVENKPGIGNNSKAKNFADTVISLPFNPYMTDDEIHYLFETLKKISNQI
jgi:UDP-2-acetamido-2-deoxy-ribo-hexuluronate aminotransferase